MSTRARDAMLSGLSPVAAETCEAEAQCDLVDHTELDTLRSHLAQAQQAAQESRQAAEEAQAAAAQATEALQEERAQAALRLQSQPQPVAQATASARAVEEPAGSSPPAHDVPSAVVAERALARLSLSGTGIPGSAGLASTHQALAQLSRWLPRGPLSESSPVSAMAEEEVGRGAAWSVAWVMRVSLPQTVLPYSSCSSSSLQITSLNLYVTLLMILPGPPCALHSYSAQRV
jgi:hypothetical protein